MAGGNGISIDPKLLEKLDKLRGNLTLEEFLEKMVSDFSQQESDTDEEIIDSTDSSDLSNESNDQEDENNTSSDQNKNIETILSKLTLIDELNSRIKELETKQVQLESKKGSETKESKRKPKTSAENLEFEIETDDGEKVKTFQFHEDSSDEVEFEFDEDDEDIDNETGIDEISMIYDFVFGCSNCHETVNEDDADCPYCGEQLEHVPSGSEWLEQLGESQAGFYEDDWGDGSESEYYSDGYEDYETDYDPSVTRPTQFYQSQRPGQDDRYYGYSEHHSSNNRIPLCHNCGGETQYVNRYGRWYCYRCTLYVSVPSTRTHSRNDTLKNDRAKVLERIQSRRHNHSAKHTSQGNKPLKYYAPYSSRDGIIKISMDDTEKPKKKK